MVIVETLASIEKPLTLANRAKTTSSTPRYEPKWPKEDSRRFSVGLTIGSSESVEAKSRIHVDALGSNVGYRPMLLSAHPDSLKLEVMFTDLNEPKIFSVLDTDTVALLLDDIIASRVYMQEKLKIYQLEVLLGDQKISINDWNKKLIDVINLQQKVKVCRRKDAKPPFMYDNLSKEEIWKICSDLRMPYQERLKREKMLRKRTVALSQILGNITKHFKNVFIEALNAKADSTKDAINNERSYDANDLHMIVVFCFQDFLSRDEFLKALATVIFTAGKSNQKLNALRILMKWIKNFRGRDFFCGGETPDHATITLLQKYYEPILEQFDKDEDFKTLKDFSIIRSEMPHMNDLSLGRRSNLRKPKNVQRPAKKDQWQIRADFIHYKSMEIFGYLDAGDFANCKHKVRRNKKSIRDMTNFSNKTSVVVATDILSCETPSSRGEKIDEWIRIANRLLRSRDYHSAQGVVGGLTQSCIYRLKKSWEFTTQGALLKMLKDRLYNKNYADQRGALVKSFDKKDDAYEHMVIPFLGMIQKDLEKVDQLPNQENNDSINKWKYHLVSKCVSKVILQKDFHCRSTEKYAQIWNEMAKLYEDAEDIDRKNGRFEKLDVIADKYVKIERTHSVRFKLVTITVLNLLMYALLFYMLRLYIEAQKRAYIYLNVACFCIANLISCLVTRSTTFVDEDEENLDIGYENEPNQEKRCFTGERVVSYLFDAIGLGILPAFWRAWKLNMLHENIYGEMDSWKTEFARQNAVSAISLHLPLVVLFLYTHIRSLEIMKIENYTMLLFPLISISFSIFLLFRGAHDTIFLVSGRTIVIAGFISLLTDFMLRAIPFIAFLSYLRKKSSCVDDDKLCVTEWLSHGEDFCDLFPINDVTADDCCDCEGGSIPSNYESLLFKLYTVAAAAVIIFYEFGWVLFFHYNYKKKEEKRVHVNIDQDISKLKIFFTKILQALVLTVTFTIINIPVLGMYRPKYRRSEHFIRILMSIAMGIMFMIWDIVIGDTSLLVAMLIVIPVHMVAYLFFERAMSQEDEVSNVPYTSFFKSASTLFDLGKINHDRISSKLFRKGKAKSSDLSLSEVKLVLVGEESTEHDLYSCGSQQSTERKTEVELQMAIKKAHRKPLS